MTQDIHRKLHARLFALLGISQFLSSPKAMDTLAAREISRMMADNSVTQDPLEGPVLLSLPPQCDFISAGYGGGLR